MNLLTEPAPEVVIIDGAEIPINADFRASIRFETEMERYDLNDEQKLLKALEIYYPAVPKNLPAAIERMLWFYRAGKDPSEGTGSRKGGPIYSYTFDDEYIYAAFLEQYRVDLQAVPFLHWWKFRAMFFGLKSDTWISKIMGYREMEITSKMSKEEKSFYREMKKRFAIPLPKSERERLNAIEEALLHGGDLRGVL